MFPLKEARESFRKYRSKEVQKEEIERGIDSLIKETCPSESFCFLTRGDLKSFITSGEIVKEAIKEAISGYIEDGYYIEVSGVILNSKSSKSEDLRYDFPRSLESGMRSVDEFNVNKWKPSLDDFHRYMDIENLYINSILIEWDKE